MRPIGFIGKTRKYEGNDAGSVKNIEEWPMDFHQEIADIARMQRNVTEFFTYPIYIRPTGLTPDFCESEWNQTSISVAIAICVYANLKRTRDWKRATVLNSEVSRG